MTIFDTTNKDNFEPKAGYR